MLYPASVLVLGWDPRDGTVVGGQRRGKFGKFSHSGRVTGKLSTCITDDSCKPGSAYTGRMVNGRIARAASEYYETGLVFQHQYITTRWFSTDLYLKL